MVKISCLTNRLSQGRFTRSPSSRHGDSGKHAELCDFFDVLAAASRSKTFALGIPSLPLPTPSEIGCSSHPSPLCPARTSGIRPRNRRPRDNGLPLIGNTPALQGLAFSTTLSLGMPRL